MDLQTTWFFLWGLLWAAFFLTDGFDFGIGALYPFLAKNEQQKRVMINSLGPLWDGNEVWLITAGGVTFAAFPQVYAVMFSTLYTPLMLVLFALIFRGVSFEFRHHIDSPGWKKMFDIFIFLGSVLPAILLGVAFGNIFQGIPFDGEGVYHGSLFSLLNPYGLFAGALFMVIFLVHGALWICIKADGDLQARAISWVKKLWIVELVATVLFLVHSFFATNLFDNYFNYPALWLILAVAVVGLLGIRFFVEKGEYYKAWISSAVAIIGTTFYGIAGLFPALFPSSIDAAFTLTAFNASSSPLTLRIMLTVVVIFIPLVIAYQFWAYRLFSNKLPEDKIMEEGIY